MQPHPLRVAWEARDPDAVASCFTPDGQFHSPVIGDTLSFRGRSAIAELMRVVLNATSGTVFTDELREAGRVVLDFRTEFRGRPIRGLIRLDLASDGQVRELWTFVRPLTGAVAVAAAMGPGMARREHPVLGLVARVGIMPTVGLAHLTDRIGCILIRRLNRANPPYTSDKPVTRSAAAQRIAVWRRR